MQYNASGMQHGTLIVVIAHHFPKTFSERLLLYSPDLHNLHDLTLSSHGIHFASLCPIYQAAQITLDY